MLVIISDLHLNDGSTGANLHPGAFHIFADRMRYLAARASWRADGTYRPVDQIDLVLLGDVLDLVGSNHWLNSPVKPWDDVNSPEMAHTVNRIVDDIIARNGQTLALLRSLASQGSLCVAPGGHNGQPVYQSPPTPIPVRAYYMVGNHDWMLHLPGRPYDVLRQKLAQHMGLANPLGQVFPHDPTESEPLLDSMRRHHVVARHGDIFDPLNFTEDRDSSSLGDAITIGLINRFKVEVQQQLASDAPATLVHGLRELDYIRPILLAPVWIEGLLERTCPNPSMRKLVKQTWDRLADELLQLEMVRQRDTYSPFELVDGLDRALKFSKRLSVGWASKISAWQHGLRGADSGSYYSHALAEPDFRNRRAQHIVYGHTHRAETLPLDASFADGYVLNQMYFNAGTWRRCYRQTQLAPGEHEFIPTESMSYLAFFEGDERGGRPFETWSGTLGVGVDDWTTMSPTASETASHAASQPFSPPSVSIRPPHFNMAPVASAGTNGHWGG